MNGYLQPIAAIVVMAAAASATPAHAQEWQGTWNTTYGELRLIQNGDYIYGDYRDGIIEGIIDRASGRWRATFRNPDGAVGYAELKMQSGNRGFAGSWNWEAAALPSHNTGAADRRWTGTRRAATRPPIANFRITASRSALLSRAPVKYRNWIAAFNPPATAAAPAAVNPLAGKFPKLRDYPANFVPRSIKIDLRDVGFLFNFPNLFTEGAGRAAEIYGSYGVYVYCETETGSRPLPPMGNLPNRIFDRPRDNPIRVGDYPGSTVIDSNQGVRRFVLDQQCMNTPRARFAIQIQTNLNERQAIPARDRKFGYRSFKFYLDQLPPIGKENYSQGDNAQAMVIYNIESVSEWRDKSFLSFRAGIGRTSRIDLSGDLMFVR